MSDPSFRTGIAGLDGVTFDAGLRTHMQRVFGYMSGGLVLTGLLAFLVAANAALAGAIFGTPLRYVVMFAPFILVMIMNARVQTISLSGLKTMFWVFCGTMGLSLSSIFLVYTGESVARSFFITAATFGTMSLWGYTTKRDLTNMGGFMLMGVIGIMIASLVNLFMMSSMLQWMVSVAAVVIFTGLTAWDTQRIKQGYAESYGSESNDKMAVFGALSLYMDFINIFISLIQLTGSRRD